MGSDQDLRARTWKTTCNPRLCALVAIHLHPRKGLVFGRRIYSRHSGWEMFRIVRRRGSRRNCPPTDPGGPTNFDAGQSAQERRGYIDQQARDCRTPSMRRSFPATSSKSHSRPSTVCPSTIPEHCVCGSVRRRQFEKRSWRPEFTQSWQAVSSMAGADGNTSLCKSHRPVQRIFTSTARSSICRSAPAAALAAVGRRSRRVKADESVSRWIPSRLVRRATRASGLGRPQPRHQAHHERPGHSQNEFPVLRARTRRNQTHYRNTHFKIPVGRLLLQPAGWRQHLAVTLVRAAIPIGFIPRR